MPSDTGDAHLGDVTRKYSPRLTVEHNGFVNGTAALSHLAENQPDAAQVVVVGKTVGSIVAPVHGGLASDLLPDAQVTVFGGQSGHIPDNPDLKGKSVDDVHCPKCRVGWAASPPLPVVRAGNSPADIEQTHRKTTRVTVAPTSRRQQDAGGVGR